MIEIFKTNVIERGHATLLVDQIHENFPDYKANFDLDDCDKILRVKCVNGSIESSRLINLLIDFGFKAEVLPDGLPLSGQIRKSEHL